ncbi:MAG: Mov34/MPN/PAD-1 family protein [Candidatus Omnitrophota bacterium]
MEIQAQEKLSRAGLSPAVLAPIFEQARREYPHECCGVVLGACGAGTAAGRVRPCVNVQDRMRAEEPGVFSRSAKDAYFIDPRELLAIEKENRAKGEEVRAIYHSHIDTTADFSVEDRAFAVMEGEPACPGVRYLVVSVVKGEVRGFKLYHWDEGRKDFIE